MAKTRRKATQRETQARATRVARAMQSKPPAQGEVLKVRATAMGYHGVVRRRVGDVFLLDKRSQFTPVWMEWVNEDEPEHLTTIEDEQRRLQLERGLNKSGRQPDPLGEG